MKDYELARKIKSLRNKKALSQEELSEKTGLSLRTIQRIENGETEPRGDSLKRIATVFDVSVDEIADWTIQEDKGFLVSLNLSALSFLIFPILGILVPLIIWISKKDRIKNINTIAKSLLNFQITWVMALFIGHITISAGMILSGIDTTTGDISPTMISSWTKRHLLVSILFYVLMLLYNVAFVIVNSIRINNDVKICYAPQIRFLKRI